MRDVTWKDRLLYGAAQYLGPVLVGMVAMTLRVKVVGREHYERVRNDGNFIIACLHGRMFLPVWAQRRKGVTALVSQSRDGEAVTRLVMGLGYDTVRGSSHRGALAAVRGLVTALKRGPIAILVDGPRGPREEPKIGTVAVARTSGRPILPMVGAAWPNREFGSWDRFQLPRPFSRGVLLYGEPMLVPKSAGSDDLESYRVELRERLIALRERADRIARGEEAV